MPMIFYAKNFSDIIMLLLQIYLIIITLAGIVMYFAGYNEQISGLKCILARRIWNCLLPPAIVLS